MNGGRLLLGLLGCALVCGIILSLAALLLAANRSPAFLELQRALGQLLGG